MNEKCSIDFRKKRKYVFTYFVEKNQKAFKHFLAQDYKKGEKDRERERQIDRKTTKKKKNPKKCHSFIFC